MLYWKDPSGEQGRDQQAAAARRRQLAAALGINDDAIVTALSAFGFDASTAPLVEIVPAIRVAWADGSLSAGEREEIARLLSHPEMESSGRVGSRLVAGWLAEEPSGDFYRVVTAALRHCLVRLDAGVRTRIVNQIVGDCTAVARSSGGLLGLGALSSAESNRIRDVVAALSFSSTPSSPIGNAQAISPPLLSCTRCGSRETEPVTTMRRCTCDAGEWVRCDECGHIFTAPRWGDQ